MILNYYYCFLLFEFRTYFNFNISITAEKENLVSSKCTNRRIKNTVSRDFLAYTVWITQFQMIKLCLLTFTNSLKYCRFSYGTARSLHKLNSVYRTALSQAERCPAQRWVPLIFVYGITFSSSSSFQLFPGFFFHCGYSSLSQRCPG